MSADRVTDRHVEDAIDRGGLLRGRHCDRWTAEEAEREHRDERAHLAKIADALGA